MPDSKITALTALTAADPAVDMFPVVDVSDTTMAASGTTKRISINNILACSPAATLASATITGDLTVDTSTLKVDSANDRVGVGTASPAAGAKLGVLGATSVSASDYILASTWAARFTGSSNGASSGISFLTYSSTGQPTPASIHATPIADYRSALIATYAADSFGAGYFAVNRYNNAAGATVEHYKIDNTGVATWSNVGGVAGTAMTLNATGLGVGTSPSYKLDVLSSGANTRINSADVNGAYIVWANNGTAKGYIGSAYHLLASGSANDFTVRYENNLLFSYGNQTKMTLDASGNLLVGSALPVSGGRISGNSSTGPAGRFFSSAGDNQFAAMFDKSSATNTTSQWLIGFTINNQATGSGQINANGASQAAFGTFSDSRLKENIVSLPSQLANILSLRPVEFDYKDGSGHQIGFVAQEMQEVYSDAVGEQNGFLTVTGWSKTEARLVSAIKELAAKVQALEAKLA